MNSAFLCHPQAVPLPHVPLRAINCTAGIITLLSLHGTWQFELIYFRFSTSQISFGPQAALQVASQDSRPLLDHRIIWKLGLEGSLRIIWFQNSPMGKEGLVYIESSLMKAQLLLTFLSWSQQFLRQQQQGQLHMHSLACMTRKSIIYSSQKMMKFSNKKERQSRSLARREGSSEEVTDVGRKLPCPWSLYCSDPPAPGCPQDTGMPGGLGDGAMWSPLFPWWPV